ncbi:MAG: carboxypeptidase regulatory-like domain-containing protein [Chloroherpetonaceae bacterium]|nr:carboxypeptidase regulatory-like domain-containing protein [Chloroherpetonaceae bacterium]
MTRTFISFVISLFFLPFFFSCATDSSEDGVTGRIFNTSGVGVRNAAVSLTKESESTPAYSTTTDDSGAYRFNAVVSGNYTLRVLLDGYTTLSKSVTLGASGSSVDTLYGLAIFTGRIINSQTGTGLDSALVTFSFGTDTTFIALRGYTNSEGYYTFTNVAIGNFTCVIRRSNYFTLVINNVPISAGTRTLTPQTVTRTVTGTGFRIVLTWGQNPSDLDSHLTGPDSGTVSQRFHCYYSNEEVSGAILDVDDTDSFGPETITISQFRNGMYRYSIHNYTSQGVAGARGIDTSGATIRVYDNSGLIRTYTPPMVATNTSGNTWRVFEIDVTGGSRTIRNINTYTTASSSGDIGIFNRNTSTTLRLNKMRKSNKIEIE